MRNTELRAGRKWLGENHFGGVDYLEEGAEPSAYGFVHVILPGSSATPRTLPHYN